jgi:dihydroorotase
MNSESLLLLQQVRVLDPFSNSDRLGDVAIVNGIIKEIAPQIADISQETTIIDGRNLVLGPGLVDLYSHSGEPGREERETFASLKAAATAGGFTRINVLPDTIPIIDNQTVLKQLQAQTEEGASITKISFWGALTLALEGKQMSELVELASVATGLADGKTIENLGLLRQLLEYLKPFHRPIALVPLNRDLRGTGIMREGKESIRFGLPGDPAISETVAIASILELVVETDTPVHLMRISTSRGVEAIARAKQQGLPVTASTTWMHLLLDSQALASYDSNLRLEPPLGNPDDCLALKQGIKSGIIDAIAIDHQGYTYEEKTVAFAQAPPGAIGLEIALSLLWQKLVASGEFSPLELWQALSSKPQLCLNQKPLRCSPQERAELILFDPNLKWTFNRTTLKSLSNNTYWLDKELTGKVVKVITS